MRPPPPGSALRKRPARPIKGLGQVEGPCSKPPWGNCTRAFQSPACVILSIPGLAQPWGR